MVHRFGVVSLLIASFCLIFQQGFSTTCSSHDFPQDLMHYECWGLSPAPTDTMGHPIDTEQACIDACCSDARCSMWQFSLNPSTHPSCWLWTKTGSPWPGSCKRVSGWKGGGARSRPPAPSPPPGPVGPLEITLQHGSVNATKLPFMPPSSWSTDPTGQWFGADSLSLLRKPPLGIIERWYPVSGEIHFARTPQSRWREQLLRMRSGGLDMIAVYTFWIHHEEAQGEFDFSGRRDIKRFLQIAQDLGLKVLLRVGPWDHGEVRNGGHPDWVVQSGQCGSIRTTDPAYLNCTNAWYEALAQQVKGLFHKDGGPIILMQVDNETPDWQYLLVLKDLAIKVGMAPVMFTKTGWPTPLAGYPKDYPMLPFFGGYADQFWTNDMRPSVNSGQYLFVSEPSRLKSSYRVPAGYPWLDVEIGGGMAVAYNHRVHMSAEDMPSMHLCDVGAGVNAIGYYMYHGGNNPHSRIYSGDAPNTTLQESSFMPAGPQNPMNSESYDFFAPLGEFGQPRPHYHMMRRLHLMIHSWGHLLASTGRASPDVVPLGPTDSSTLRWVVRSSNGSGFLFVNNYQRLANLSTKTNISFNLHMGDGTLLSIPSRLSSPLVIERGIWFSWPINIPLGTRASGTPNPRIVWATAQLLTRIAISSQEEVFFFAETHGVPPEVGLVDVNVDPAKQPVGGANLTMEGNVFVFRNLRIGRDAFAFAKVGALTLRFVVLKASDADRVWIENLDAIPRILLSDIPRDEASNMLMGDGNTLHVRSMQVKTALWIFPSPKQLFAEGVPVEGEADGVFMRYSIRNAVPIVPRPDIRLLRKSGPPRPIPIAASGKAQEPTQVDWDAAAEYSVTLNLPRSFIPDKSELRLAVDYIGDAARIFYKGRLLTDNWFSGYDGHGQCEVGISYLSDENLGLLCDQAELRVQILPLQLSALKKNVFLQQSLWPDFKGSSNVLELKAVRPLVTGWTTLSTRPDSVMYV